MAGSIYNLEFRSAGMHCLQLRQLLVDLCKNLHFTFSVPEMFNLQMNQIFTVVFENGGCNFMYILLLNILYILGVFAT